MNNTQNYEYLKRQLLNIKSDCANANKKLETLKYAMEESILINNEIISLDQFNKIESDTSEIIDEISKFIIPQINDRIANK